MNRPPGIYDDWFEDSEIEGLRFRVDVATDEETNPRKFGDSITPEQVRRWEQGLWEFVTVTVVPVYGDVEIDECAASLGGVVSGFFDSGQERIGREQLAEYPVTELVDEALGKLRGPALGSAVAGFLQDAIDAQEDADKLKELQASLAAT